MRRFASRQSSVHSRQSGLKRFVDYRLSTADCRLLGILCLCAAIITGACGKKGPPLAPLVLLPAAVENFAARRLGLQVFFQFKVPTTNTDGSHPADLMQVEIYGHSGPLASPADYLRDGTLVGAVKVKRPPSTAEEKPAAPAAEPGVDQGATTALVEMLTPATLTLPPATPPPPAIGTPAVTGPTTATPAVAPAPARFYVAVGVSRKGRRGALSLVVGVPVVALPAAPTALQASSSQDAISLKWTEDGSDGRSAPGSATPSDASAEPPAATAYNVYEVESATKVDSPRTTSEDRMPMPLNSSPLTARAFDDARIEFGVERCYIVRAVATVGDLSLESEPSPPVCVTPVDKFPPSAPRLLAAVASEGAVSLIWEANTEKDLAGYLVLRGEAPGEKLAALTVTPIRETTYRDTTVRRGVTYVYVVVAVDNAAPPNVSEYSNRVDEVVR